MREIITNKENKLIKRTGFFRFIQPLQCSQNKKSTTNCDKKYQQMVVSFIHGISSKYSGKSVAG